MEHTNSAETFRDILTWEEIGFQTLKVGTDKDVRKNEDL